MAVTIKNDNVQGAVELGPRSLALLRRLLVGLEEMIGHPIDDPGKPYEDGSLDWNENQGETP
jgi:hypothetical protein